MTGVRDRPRIAQFGSLPPEVSHAVSSRADLLPFSEIAPDDALRINHGLTTAMHGAPPEILDRLPNLDVIASCGAGLDRFDFGLLAERGITLHHTAHVMTLDTAEMAVTLVQALLRGIIFNDRHVREGDWASARPPMTARIAGKKAGIVGLGQIGSAVARTLDALGLSVSYTGPRAKTDVPWTFIPHLSDLALGSDVLVLTCAGGAATRHIIHAGILGALGPNGYLVNVSRGSVVDEAALIEALESRQIAGAALDVFENEPTPDARFMALPNVVLQPHAATYTRENRAFLVAEILRMLDLSD